MNLLSPRLAFHNLAMYLFNISIYLANHASSSALPDPASIALPDPVSIALLPRQNDGARGCGIATNAQVTFSYTLVGDAYCRDLHANGDEVKSYIVAEGCICLFYANDQCSKTPVEQWTGWVFGPAHGDFTKKGTTHYLCGEGSNPFRPPRM